MNFTCTRYRQRTWFSNCQRTLQAPILHLTSVINACSILTAPEGFACMKNALNTPNIISVLSDFWSKLRAEFSYFAVVRYKPNNEILYLKVHILAKSLPSYIRSKFISGRDGWCAARSNRRFSLIVILLFAAINKYYVKL